MAVSVIDTVLQELQPAPQLRRALSPRVSRGSSLPSTQIGIASEGDKNATETAMAMVAKNAKEVAMATVMIVNFILRKSPKNLFQFRLLNKQLQLNNRQAVQSGLHGACTNSQTSQCDRFSRGL